MFTKKPEQEVGGDPLWKMSDRQVSETTPFGERPPSYAKTSVPSKLVPSIIGEIQVDDEIQGDVQCGSLLLGDKSQITGCVLADDVVVRGRVIGSIRGLRVTLQAQSHVEGDIYHQSLAIEQGAYFEGKSRRSDDPLAIKQADKPATASDAQPATPNAAPRAAE